MDYGDHQCVGCDAHTFGIYRTDANWHLCWSCYEMWKDENNDTYQMEVEKTNG